jgi:hypothetical protein
VDISEYRNIAAFINHTCRNPNSEVTHLWSHAATGNFNRTDAVPGDGDAIVEPLPTLGVYSRHDIRTGEEILMDYGKDQTPLPCLCQVCLARAPKLLANVKYNGGRAV